MTGRSSSSPSASSCWPGALFGYSPSPVKARAADTIFEYDLGLLRQEQTALDMPWGTHTSATDMEKGCGWIHDKNQTCSDSNGKQDFEDGSMEYDTKSRFQCGLLAHRKADASRRSLCGVMGNPLLTSRLALMAVLALLLIVMTALTWVLTSSNVQHSVSSISAKFRRQLLLHSADSVDAVLHGNNASSDSLASFLSSVKEDYLASAAGLHDQVRPVLFLTFSILSKKTQVTYFGQDGLLLSFASDASGSYLTYSNISYLSGASQASTSLLRESEMPASAPSWYQWSKQRVDERGYPVGEALSVPAVPFWKNRDVRTSLQTPNGMASWAPSLVDFGSVIFAYLSPVFPQQVSQAVGVISVGVPTPGIDELLNGFNYQGGAMFLATVEGHLVAQSQGGPLSTIADSTFLLATQSSNALVADAAKYLNPYFSYISTMEGQSFTEMKLEIRGARYILDSAPIRLAGATLICTVILPYNSIWGITQKWSHITIAVLVALATTMGIVGCFFVLLLTKGVSNEMRLRAALIQQLEETKRAETKSNHKSLVFANMSHDLRTPLAAILGLIDLCLCDASETSEVGSNLIQMKSCATNLLGILNSILDMSKIEAGKLLLQESEFDLAGALEEVIDTFSVVGLKKDIEVALDLSDGFVEKASWVVGDVGRVKQIMANLLSNGVKFTSEGHVVLRGWIKPFGILASRPQLNYRGKHLYWPWSQLIKSPSREKEIRKIIQGFSEQDQDENHIHVEFEVDDTGRGIPKERWKSVFENFVQVESSGPRNYDGTGLGLGIVRSLVRLMGGDIKITDKDEPGEPGTRFRFDLVFKRKKQLLKHGLEEAATPDVQLQDGASLQATFGVSADSVSPRWPLDSTGAFVFANGVENTGFDSPPIMEGVHVILAMPGQAGKRVVRKWMERRGLQVWAIGRWEELLPTIEKIRHEVFCPSFNASDRFDQKSPECHNYDPWVDDMDASMFAQDETSFDECRADSEGMERAHKPDFNMPLAHLLLVLDVSLAASTLNVLFSDLKNMLAEIGQSIPFRVAWLVNANTLSSDIQSLKRQTKLCNLILHKPLYTSRLKCIWDLLQDLVGNGASDSYDSESSHMPAVNREKVDLSSANSLFTSLACMSTFHHDARSSHSRLDLNRSLGVHSSSLSVRDTLNAGAHGSRLLSREHGNEQMMDSTTEADQVLSSQESVSHKDLENTTSSKQILNKNALADMRILVAEDNPILQRLTKTQLVRLGAIVECVNNGAEAARLVLGNLYKSRVSSPEGLAGKLSDGVAVPERNESHHPFNLVLMDCEMPILNGYEATQRIRSEESRYGIRTPVIALTAHAMAQDEKKCIEAGMDFYLTKPLAVGALLDVVSKIFSKNLEAV